MSLQPEQLGPAGEPSSTLPWVDPTLSPTELKFAVLQLGARLHYAVPAVLQQANMLRAFYTDVVGDIGVLNVMGRFLRPVARSKQVRRLFGRRLPKEVPRDAVVSAPGRSLAHAALSRLLGTGHLTQMTSPDSWLKKTIVDEDFRGANALYALDNSDSGVIREASRRGMFIAYEQIICANSGRIMREERARFPGVEAQDPEELVEEGIRADLEVYKMSNVVLAASEFVRGSLIKLGCPAEKIAIVPYGVDQRWLDIEARPVPGRVLFVGTVGLRKGNHYLAEAYRILRDRGVDTEFRVVGPHAPDVPAAPIFQGPHYIGQVPRTQVTEEFAQADVFVLPTVAEGFGLVHLEAMACGVPVVTTPNCGSVVRDGVDGYIVPIRDPHILADRIESIIRDRAERTRMSRNARERASQFTWPAYSKSLVRAIVQAEAVTAQSLTLARPRRPVAQALNR
jgi:hypothetical protein